MLKPLSHLQFTGANPALTAGEIAHILTKSEPAVIITSRSGLDNFQAAFSSLSPEIQAHLGYRTRGNVFLVDPESDDYGASAATLNQAASSLINGWHCQSWKVLLPAKPAAFTVPQYAAGEDDLRAAIIFWSSGTSAGKSKGVILSHKALGSALIACWHGSGLKENERECPFEEVPARASKSLHSLLCRIDWPSSVLPHFWLGQHLHGRPFLLGDGDHREQSAQRSVVSSRRITTLIHLPQFDPHQYLRLAQETRATHLHIAPPVAVLFAKSPLRTLRPPFQGSDLSNPLPSRRLRPLLRQSLHFGRRSSRQQHHS